MRKFLSFVFLATVAAGVVWFESRPTTVTIPIETNDSPYQAAPGYHPPTTTSPPSTTRPKPASVSFEKPNVTLQVSGSGGDNVTLYEVIGKPLPLDKLSSEMKAIIRECPGVTERDLVVRIDAKLELNSSLPADVDVDYGTSGRPAVFAYSSGLKCDDGHVNHKMFPGKYSSFSYWVVLSGAVSPDHPAGNPDTVWALSSIDVKLPNFQTYTWQLWGSRVVDCKGVLGHQAQIWLAGTSPAKNSDSCKTADTKERAAQIRES